MTLGARPGAQQLGFFLARRRDPLHLPVINVCALVMTAQTRALDKYDKLGLS